MLKRVMWALGYVRYVSIVSSERHWCHISDVQELLDRGCKPVMRGSQRILWDSLGTNDGYYELS